MSPPDRVDDPTITDDTVLWRGISPYWIRVDPVGGHEIAASGAFKTEEMSVYIVSETTREAVLAAFPPGWKLQAFTAGDARKADCIIVRDSLPPNLAGHALVCRKDNPSACLTAGQAKKIAKAAQWLAPEGGS